MTPETLSPPSNDALAKLREKILATNSRLCIGLDYNPVDFPGRLHELVRSSVNLIDKTAPQAAAFKFQFAGYLAWGKEGLELLSNLVGYTRGIHPDTLIILDGKFTDIDASLRHYASYAFETLRVDAVTASPYLGLDAVAPLLAYENKLIYFLCSTSNPDSGQFQDTWHTRPLYQDIAAAVNHWNVRSGNCGLVAGATHPERLVRIREAAPHLPFLMPGLGAQGATLDSFLPLAATSAPESVLVNVSRSIIGAPDPVKAAAGFHDRLMLIETAPPLDRKQTVAEALLACGVIQHGEFTLASGETSPFYIDLRRLLAFPETMELVARELARELRQYDAEVIATIPTAGIALATLVSRETRLPLCYVRTAAKDHGTKSLIEGAGVEGKKVVLLDDVLSTGVSKNYALNVLAGEGATVTGLVVVVDRRLDENLQLPVPTSSLLKLSDLVS